jgi:hypothetical protein
VGYCKNKKIMSLLIDFFLCQLTLLNPSIVLLAILLQIDSNEGGGFKYNSHAARPGKRPHHGDVLFSQSLLLDKDDK